MSDFRGLVLSNTIYKESDVIMNVLTEEGKISIKAKGVLKPNSKNRSFTEVGCYSLFHTIDKISQNIYTLKNAEKVKRFSNIENDLIRKTIFSCLLEVFHKLDYQLDEAILYVEQLNTCKNPYCLYACLLCDIMKKSGIPLVVDGCVCCCDIKKIYGLSIVDGGFVCTNCFDANRHMHLSIEDLKNIRYCMHATIDNYPILEENTTVTFDIIRYLIAFLRNFGEIIIRSHEFLEIIEPLD